MRQLKFLYLLLLMFQVSTCQTNTNDEISLKQKDIALSDTYNKFYENRLDYGNQKGKARDTILDRFKKSLLNTLKNNKSATFPFDSLANTIKLITSKDKKLRIFSWDELNGGTWHIYNSAYQYNQLNNSFSGLLTAESDNPQSPMFTDITHFKIVDIEPNKYLVKGYGTHGSGEEFFVYRLLSFSNGKIIDCSKCFDGKDSFVFTRPRSSKLELDFNQKTREIVYPEMTPSIHEGEETGFIEPSGKTLRLKYENGAFVKSNQ